MRLSDLLLTLFRFLIPPALILTIFLYSYAPLLDCTFPVARRAEAGCSIPGQEKDAIPGEVAPFRLLAFGDPQLEGDTSLPDPNAPLFPSLSNLKRTIRNDGLSGWSTTLQELFLEDLPRILKGYRKRLDLWGNDLYLAHIYRSVSWWSDPTHIVVLGDLLGSQWISDNEFQRRSDRFWNVVFKGAEKVPRSITESSNRVEVLGQDQSWSRRIIAVAGNHDIGYAGDVDAKRIERFEDAFGNVNWGISFKLNNSSAEGISSLQGGSLAGLSTDPEIRLIILNSMNLDSAAKDLDLQQQSRDFALSQLSQASTSPTSATVLLTHIPFHKETGVCKDDTLFTWFPNGGIKEQNHLSKETSRSLLDGLTGGAQKRSKRGNAIVLNGHDHEGCDTYHCRVVEPDVRDTELHEDDYPPQWHARHFDSAQTEIADSSGSGLREITVRSMMGSFSGNAGFLSAWFDRESGEWKFDYNSCFLGVQHIWWAVHVFDIIVVLLGLGGLITMVIEELMEARKEQKQKLKKA